MATTNNRLRPRRAYKRPVNKSSADIPVTSTIYNVMDNSRRLSDQKIITKTSGDGEPIQDSLAVLSAFGMTVVEEPKSVESSLLSDAFIDSRKLETLQKTQDTNPNRLQQKKFKNLKNKKVPIADVFNQAAPNPINDLDTCQANEYNVSPKPSFNVIEITNDFINFSPLPLSTRIKTK